MRSKIEIADFFYEPDLEIFLFIYCEKKYEIKTFMCDIMIMLKCHKF